MVNDGGKFVLSSRAGRSHEQPISFLMQEALANPNVISLAAGLVDYDTLPVWEIRRLTEELLRDDAMSRKALQYGTTEGLAALRTALLRHLEELDGLRGGGLDATADDVIVSTGSQQLLLTIADVLVNPGDIVITAWPSYFVFTGTLQALGAEVRCAEMDEDGIKPDSLEAILCELEASGSLARVKIVYICDYHQNPTGITLSAERRPALLDIVRRFSKDHRILLLEDAAYRELTFSGSPPLSIKRYDAGNRHVALVQTFSKPFAPGMRTGYGLLPRELVGPVLDQKGNHDFGSNNFSQFLLLAAMRDGLYAEHVGKLRRAYAGKCRAMLDAMDEHLGKLPGVRWTKPAGGLYVYLTLADGMDSGRGGALFARAVKEGVIYVPGEYCYPPDPTRQRVTNAIRLSYGICTVEQIRQGIARLARAIKAVQK